MSFSFYQDSRAAQEVFASLMASENVYINFSEKADTASIDPLSGDITLPTYSGISQNVIDMFTAHEVSHAIFSSSIDNPIAQQLNTIQRRIEAELCRLYGEEWYTPRYLAIWGDIKYLHNVILDIKDETLIAKKYPGLVNLFATGYSYLYDNDIGKWFTKSFEYFNPSSTIYEDVIANPGASLYSKMECMFTRINFYAKFNKRVYLSRLYSLTDEEVRLYEDFCTCKTIADVCDMVVKTLCEFFAKMTEKDRNEIPVAQERQPGNDTKKDETEKDETKNGETTGNNSFLESFELEDALAECRTSTKNKIAVIPETLPENMIVPWTIIRDNINNWNKTSIHNSFGSSPVDQWKKYVAGSKKMVEMLVAEFNATRSAMTFARSRTEKKGRIDPQLLMHFRTRPEIFKNTRVEFDAKSHCLVLLLDWSASMIGNVYSSMVQLVDFIWFCRICKIPFRVFAFSSANVNSLLMNKRTENIISVIRDKKDYAFNKERKSHFRFTNCTLLELFDYRMTKEEFEEMGGNWLKIAFRHDCKQILPEFLKLEATPLLMAMTASIPILKELKEQSRAEKCSLFVISDGEDTENLLKDRKGNVNRITLMDSSGNKFENIRPSRVPASSGELAQYVKTCTGANTANLYLFSETSRTKLISMASRVWKNINRRKLDCDPAKDYSKQKTFLKNSIVYNGFVDIPGTGWDACMMIPTAKSRDKFVNNDEGLQKKITKEYKRAKQQQEQIVNNYKMNVATMTTKRAIVRLIIKTLNKSMMSEYVI